MYIATLLRLSLGEDYRRLHDVGTILIGIITLYLLVVLLHPIQSIRLSIHRSIANPSSPAESAQSRV